MKDGKESGVWEGFYDNGDIRDKKAFNDGALDPDNTEIYAPKKPLLPKKEDVSKEPAKIAGKNETANSAYKPFDGNGCSKLFIPGGRLSKDGCFKNYRLMDGKDYVYNTDGILERIAVYKDGKYVGDAPIEEKDK